MQLVTSLILTVSMSDPFVEPGPPGRAFVESDAAKECKSIYEQTGPRSAIEISNSASGAKLVKFSEAGEPKGPFLATKRRVLGWPHDLFLEDEGTAFVTVDPKGQVVRVEVTSLDARMAGFVAASVAMWAYPARPGDPHCARLKVTVAIEAM